MTFPQNVSCHIYVTSFPDLTFISGGKADGREVRDCVSTCVKPLDNCDAGPLPFNICKSRTNGYFKGDLGTFPAMRVETKGIYF